MNRPQAPEIFQTPIAQIDATGLPPRGSPEFDQALIARYALSYATKGWNAVVTVDDKYVRVVAVPERGIEPKQYVLGLLQHRYLEDALPILEALYGMVDDAEIAYNYGICLSELGRIEESVPPLERCIELDKGYTNAYVGLGVAYTRLGRNPEAEKALRQAIAQDPENAFAKRNLAAVLARSGKAAEALPYFRQAASLAPNDAGVHLGLAQCLDELGGDYRKEADKVYSEVARRFSDHPVAEIAKKARNKIANAQLHATVDGNVRMDAVFYMQGAMDDFAKKIEAGDRPTGHGNRIAGAKWSADQQSGHAIHTEKPPRRFFRFAADLHHARRNTPARPESGNRHRARSGVRAGAGHAREEVMVRMARPDTV